MKVKGKILIAILLLVTVAISIRFYQKSISPTRVGLVNYPEFIYTKLATANTNSSIKLEALQPDSLPNLNKYDMLLIFGMGIELPAEQEQKIIETGENGTKIYLQASTNPKLQLTNIQGKQLDEISGYLDNGGNKNYRNMLNYIRREIDGKTFKSDSISAPLEIASDVLFHINEDAVFDSVRDFEKYCLENGFHQKGFDKVILFTSVPGPFNANREHLNSLISELQSRNMNVYPISGFRGRLNYMKEINPALIVYMPHGRLSMGGSPQAMEAWLKKQNVPILCPVSVMQKYDDWLKDKQGMVGGYLGQSVTMPEFDGGIVPYAVFAQYENDKGLLLFKAIPNRLTKFGDIAENYIDLQKKKNADEKLAIVYFKGPGKNALEAANMEVLPSLHNTLLRLKKEGYNVDGLPNDYPSFRDKVMQQGPVLGPYAKGAFDEYLSKGNPELINVSTYENWCRESLPTELYAEVEERYGKAPGSYMSVYKDTTDYLAIARVQFGNVVLLPQPLPGIGENEFALVHGAKVAPPHAYIAPYLWIQKGFNADAIFHFGTHGSLEFTPGKQIALSDYDWTDPLIGTTPHFYVYTISNVGEGMIAKRRSYAVTQTYLTPPFIEAQAFAKRKEMHTKLHKYEQTSGALKTEYALSVKKLAVQEGIHKDIGLDSILTQPYTEAEMMQLTNYLEEIEHEKVTGGLYTMGIPYAPDKLNETIQLMLVDALAYNLAELDLLKGKIARKQFDDKMFFNEKYTHPCENYIRTVMSSENPEAMFKKLVSQADRERAEKWNSIKNPKTAHANAMKKHHAEQMTGQKNDTIATETEKNQIRALIIQILPSDNKVAFIQKLESDKEYERTMGLLDDETLAKAKKMAKMIPAMGEAIETASDSVVHQILVLIQKEELRQLALSYTKDENLETEVAQEKARQDSVLIAEAIDVNNLSVIENTDRIQGIPLIELKQLKSKLDFYGANCDKLLSLLSEKKESKLISFLENDYTALSEKVNTEISRLENIENDFANAINIIETTLKNVLTKKQDLHLSPEFEFQAILNSLNGGYTAPSPGGDPVANPAAVPTGRNLFSVNAEQTPSREAWEVGKKLTKSLLADYKKKHDGAYPQKISFTLWSSSFIETEGTTIAQILYMLGVEPVWDAFGRVNDIRIIPTEELNRPRIDVVVQTSGQLRDLAASRLFLINKAINKVALEAEKENNFVNKGMVDAERRLMELGYSPLQARQLSTKRVFGGVNGNYGTGIMGMVEKSGRWDSTKAVAQTYLNNMGAIYSDEGSWGDFDKSVFEAALLNTEVVVQPRQSNTWGALSLDHVYEFMGGLNLAVREVTGNDAESYFNDFRNASNPRVQGLKEAVWVETRTTLLNPRYIKEYMKGGASSAETFAETFRNTFGWNVMKPSAIENRLWDELYNTYVQDEQKLGIHEFFEDKNPYALQEMTAVMLETVRKDMWKATPEQIEAMAKLHATLVKDHEAGCSGFVCDNNKLRAFIASKLPDELSESYNEAIDDVRNVKIEDNKKSVVLKKEEQQKLQENRQAKPNEKKANNMIWYLLLGIVLLLALFLAAKRKK